MEEQSMASACFGLFKQLVRRVQPIHQAKDSEIIRVPGGLNGKGKISGISIPPFC